VQAEVFESYNRDAAVTKVKDFESMSILFVASAGWGGTHGTPGTSDSRP